MELLDENRGTVPKKSNGNRGTWRDLGVIKFFRGTLKTLPIAESGF